MSAGEDTARKAAEIVVEQRHRDAARGLLALLLIPPTRIKAWLPSFSEAFARFERDHMPSPDTHAAKVEAYDQMHAIAVNDLGYPSILEALEAAPHALAPQPAVAEAVDQAVVAIVERCAIIAQGYDGPRVGASRLRLEIAAAIRQTARGDKA